MSQVPFLLARFSNLLPLPPHLCSFLSPSSSLSFLQANQDEPRLVVSCTRQYLIGLYDGLLTLYFIFFLSLFLNSYIWKEIAFKIPFILNPSVAIVYVHYCVCDLISLRPSPFSSLKNIISVYLHVMLLWLAHGILTRDIVSMKKKHGH